MNQVEKKLLDNLFDSLDRLFDRECKTFDLYSLLYASEKALGVSPIIALESYSIDLEKIVQKGNSEEFQREEALKITNNLRILLNELLSI